MQDWRPDWNLGVDEEKEEVVGLSGNVRSFQGGQQDTWIIITIYGSIAGEPVSVPACAFYNLN